MTRSYATSNSGGGGGGGGTPSAPVNSIQYNNAGSFGGSTNLTYDGTSLNTFGFPIANASGLTYQNGATLVNSSNQIILKGLGLVDTASLGGNAGQVLTRISASDILWEDPIVYVPYTGATGNVDLGNNAISAFYFKAYSNSGIVFYIDGGLTDTFNITNAGAYVMSLQHNTVAANIDFSNVSGTQNFALPATGGTIALTSDIPVVPTSFFQLPTGGSVDGVNQSFTWTTAPNAIVVDGATLQATEQGGVINWTGTTSIVLTVPPVNSLFAIA